MHLDLGVAPPRALVYAEGDPRIALLQAGHGPAVIFLHGLGATKEIWHPQITYFSENYTAIAWDMRGYGDSGDFDGPVRFATDVADDLLRVLTERRISCAHLVGLSMGGFIAQCFYHRYPDRVRSLVLADSFESFSRLLSPAQLAAFLKARRDPLILGISPGDVAEETATALLGNNPSIEARRAFVAVLSALRPATYVRAMEALAAEDYVRQATEIRVPTCIIVGEEDRLTPWEACRTLAGKIPGAEFHSISEAGHMTSLEQPMIFNQIIEKFLERQA
jgi:3-oxoadipate enol-lactonase